ncbi:DUF2304 domain-containing protein [Cohnella sp. REN36]|uniref:DUF2304 domain-containing protein n=1 Tax=Cohnella sp. REN36 TaxID=2887347 RepID=UPI001D1522FE|nr:DUF2304 domain-containing protein [Cohnella sp. REN36]MCC3374098.1 DUF2304 domain-containing protein [Cohnella sp. REN36]
MDYKLVVLSRVVSLFVAVYIINKTRKNLLNEKESLFWVLGSLIMLLISFFPRVLDVAAKSIGIQYPPAMLFLVVILVILLILYRQFAKWSLLNKKLNYLVRTVALLSNELEELKRTKKE